MTANQQEQAHALADGLRSLAAWIDEHPEYAPIASGGARFNAYVGTRDELVAARRTLGRVTKDAIANFFYVRRDFGGGVTLDVNVPQGEVCRRVVTGTQEIPERTVPARTEEIVEWVCDEPLLAAPAEAVA